MAMVDAMPIPDSRKKVDELFLFWLSEPSTQEILRNELSKVCRNDELAADGSGSGGDLSRILENLVQQQNQQQQQPGYRTDVQRSGSPSNYRTPSPPLHLSNSPKSPRAKRRARSPRRSLKHGLLGAAEKGASSSSSGGPPGGSPLFDEVDYFPSALATSTIASPPSSASVEPETRGTSQNATAEKEAKKSEGGRSGEDRRRPRVASGSGKVSDAEVIPRFFFPNGRLGGSGSRESVDEQLKEVERVIREELNGEATMPDFHLVTKVTVEASLAVCVYVCALVWGMMGSDVS